MFSRKICVVGLGYIGLPTAALLASNNYLVLGVDIDPKVVDTINKGQIHIVEPQLETYVKNAVADKLLTASLQVSPSDIYMICVPTPFHPSQAIPEPDIGYVLAAARSIAPFLKKGNLVILESTSPVGTTARIAEEFLKLGVDIDAIDIAYCPERVLPGKIMSELVSNDRIIGGLTPEATEKVAEFYETFVSGEVLRTDAATAEMCKLTENSFRDVNIAFANELSLICDREGIDVWKLIDLANHHPRVNILQPGPGVGGHCIAVDPWFIVSRNPEDSKIIKLARETNDGKTNWVIERIDIAARRLREQGVEPVIACLGLAFKPDIDDLRESPSARIAEMLVAKGHSVLAVEPNISVHASLELATIDEALARANIFAILVKHQSFMANGVKQKLKDKGALDFCGLIFP
ncbi:MAG: UDP-N-acetyl-D-mannosamine dehydrogenase [Sphingorhabdus sp.]